MARIFSAPGTRIQRARGELRFSLICTVEEGLAGRFSNGTWADPVLDPLLEQLVAQIGWKRVEHAPGRQIVLRCTAPASATGEAEIGSAVCLIDLGGGFEPLEIRTSD